ncbi:hypothetical protein [Priestia abyssalis]|uniref:hypothetical protein n=1 Tax=Priestia abyssalis TaxID=1221450 RepID=UPI000995D12B|nr:hypothetical protein [Priestia abyssalis]
MMNNDRVFLEDLKSLVENRLPLNEYLIERMQEKFDKSPSMIARLYHLFDEKRSMLPFIDVLEEAVYELAGEENMS